MVTINELFKAGFDWDNLIIDEEEYEQLSADLVIDYLKKDRNLRYAGILTIPNR